MNSTLAADLDVTLLMPRASVTEVARGYLPAGTSITWTPEDAEHDQTEYGSDHAVVTAAGCRYSCRYSDLKQALPREERTP